MYVADSWSDLWNDKRGQVRPTAEPTTAEVVYQRFRETDSYGEYLQGDDEIYMIFKVQTPEGEKHFKKFGYQSSYGDMGWDGPVVEVYPKTKTITVWE